MSLGMCLDMCVSVGMRLGMCLGMSSGLGARHVCRLMSMRLEIPHVYASRNASCLCVLPTILVFDFVCTYVFEFA